MTSHITQTAGVDAPTIRVGRGRWSRLRKSSSTFWFVLPAAATMILVLGYPMGVAFYYAFTGWSLVDPESRDLFVGFDNYVAILSDPEYWAATRVTVTFAFSAVAIELVLGTALAVFLNARFLGRSLFRSLLLIPMVVTPAVVGIFWKLLYDEKAGLFNYALSLVGLPAVPWLDVNNSLLAVILMDVWQATPFFMLIILAGLQSLDVETVDAARVDGASPLQIFRFLTLPHLVPFMLIAAAFRIIAAMGDFDKIYLLTLGGPGNTTTTISIFAFKTGFSAFDVGRTTAISWIFVVLVLAVSSPLIWYLFRVSEARSRW
jgi:multiple sugar transport system permease protein/sorbitol/mannitol transport system permease protein